MGGPLPISVGGNRFFIIFVYDFSHMVWIFFMPTKSANSAFSAWTEFKRSIGSGINPNQISRLRSDNGNEFDNHEMQNDLCRLGINWEPSAPYTQHQNGVAERMIQSLQNMARTMLHEAHVAEGLWPEAMRTAAYLRNRSPTSALNNKMTPYEVWHGKKPSLAHVRPFSCPAYALVPPELRKAKFDSRTKRCLLMGYVHDTQKMWRL